jgi:hypothetical protein
MHQLLALPLPRSRGFGACADAGEAGEGVSQLAQSEPAGRLATAIHQSDGRDRHLKAATGLD